MNLLEKAVSVEPSTLLPAKFLAVVHLAAEPSMLVMPVSDCAADALFKAMDVVPMNNAEFPKTADGIVPVRLAAVRLVKLAPLTAPNEPDHVPEVIVPVAVMAVRLPVVITVPVASGKVQVLFELVGVAVMVPVIPADWRTIWFEVPDRLSPAKVGLSAVVSPVMSAWPGWAWLNAPVLEL